MSTDKNADNRKKMPALALAKECYAMKLDPSSATIVEKDYRFTIGNFWH